MVIAAKIKVYELDDNEVLPNVEIGIDSHWNRRNFAVLTVGGKRYTINADDLRRAIEAAAKAHAY